MLEPSQIITVALDLIAVDRAVDERHVDPSLALAKAEFLNNYARLPGCAVFELWDETNSDFTIVGEMARHVERL